MFGAVLQLSSSLTHTFAVTHVAALATLRVRAQTLAYKYDALDNVGPAAGVNAALLSPAGGGKGRSCIPDPSLGVRPLHGTSTPYTTLTALDVSRHCRSEPHSPGSNAALPASAACIA